MRALKSFLNPSNAARPAVVDPRLDSLRLLTEYVLNMAVSALAHGDITPLYEQYMEDARLSDDEHDELARAYLLLQMTATQATEPQ